VYDHTSNTCPSCQENISAVAGKLNIVAQWPIDASTPRIKIKRSPERENQWVWNSVHKFPIDRRGIAINPR
jgi:hypothetical protein